MGDPLSAMSAISGLLLASVKVAKEIYKFRQGFREAPDDVCQLCDNLDSIQSILQQLQDALKPDAGKEKSLPEGVHCDLMKLIGNCERIYERLLKLTKEYNGRNLRKGWERTRWAMVGEGEARKLGEMLVTHKLTLSITLQWTNHITLMSIKQEMRQGFRDVREDTGHIIDVMKDQCSSLKSVCARLDAQSLEEMHITVPRFDHFLDAATIYTNQPPSRYTRGSIASTISAAPSYTSRRSSIEEKKGDPPSDALIRRKTSSVQQLSSPSHAPKEDTSLVTIHQATDEVRSLVEPMALLWSKIEHLPEPFDRVLSSLKWRSDRLETFRINTMKQNPMHVPTEYARHCGMAMQHLSIAMNSFMVLGNNEVQAAVPTQSPFSFSIEVQQAPEILHNLMTMLHNDAMTLKYSGLELKDGHIFDSSLGPVFSQHCHTATTELGHVSNMLGDEEKKSMKRWRNVTTVLKKEDIESMLRALHEAEGALEMAVRSYPIYSKESERPDPSTLMWRQPWRSGEVVEEVMFEELHVPEVD